MNTNDYGDPITQHHARNDSQRHRPKTEKKEEIPGVIEIVKNIQGPPFNYANPIVISATPTEERVSAKKNAREYARCKSSACPTKSRAAPPHRSTHNRDPHKLTGPLPRGVIEWARLCGRTWLSGLPRQARVCIIERWKNSRPGCFFVRMVIAFVLFQVVRMSVFLCWVFAWLYLGLRLDWNIEFLFHAMTFRTGQLGILHWVQCSFEVGEDNVEEWGKG